MAVITVHGSLTFNSTTGANSFTPDAVSPPPPPPPPFPPPAPPPPPPVGFALGQRPFTITSAWNTPVSPLATYTTLPWPANKPFNGGPLSLNYVAAWDSYSPAVYVSAAADPLVAVTHPATWGRPAGSVSLRVPVGVSGANGTDGEIVIIAQDANGNWVAHNFWQFTRTSNTTATASAYGPADVFMGTGFGSTLPALGAGISAIGASELGGLIIKAETDLPTGIQHAIALRVDAPAASPGFVAPAIAGDGGSATGFVIEGQRLAIPPGTAMPSGMSPLGQQVFTAMQVYGAIVNDKTGGTYGPRVQANAYDDATITALDADIPRIIPLLKRVS